jgi:signal transduction histidine kinase
MPVRFEPDIEGYWRDTLSGYVLELRLPLAMVKQNRVSFAVADVDDPVTGQVATLIGTSGTRQSSDLGFLLTRSPELESILKALDKPQARISVIDKRRRLRASVGTFYGEPDQFRSKGDTTSFSLNSLLRPFVRLFSESYAEVFAENPGYMEEYQVEMVQTALNGQPFTSRKPLADNNAEVLLAGEPLRVGNQVMGAVIVEQPTNSILSMKNRIVEDTIKITLLVFLAGALSLLLFASRLSGRIRKLMVQTDSAIGPDGVIRQTFRPSASQDELGDLSRRFADMLTRLRDYSVYQEKMADNLEHEIRTPVAGISAALANLEKKLTPEDKELRSHLGGMQESVRRIEHIMISIREATTLDDALQQSEQNSFNLEAALAAWVQQGYKLTFPSHAFNLLTPGQVIIITGDPIRIRQMLDKIVENSVDFSPAASRIDIHLALTGSQVEIRIANQGPRLPEQMRDQIFQSMVSLRQKKGSGAHLGLGLYVARKIAEYHGGSIRAEDRIGSVSGAAFIITLPLSNVRQS